MARKSLGQNFLMDQAAVSRIAELACSCRHGVMVELGAGTGNLTMALAQRCSRIIAFEIDRRLLEWHEQVCRLPENVELRKGDILAISYRDLAAVEGGALRVAGNLPYNISSQVVFALCRQAAYITDAWLLFQKEMAKRIVSPPGSRDYGILSVVSQYSGKVTIEMDLPPTVFSPKPKVYSSLVHFDFTERSGPVAADYDFFIQTVRAAFSQRRKKILNCIRSYFKQGREEMEQALVAAGIEPDARAETLDVARFVGLSDILFKHIRQKQGDISGFLNPARENKAANSPGR